MSKRVTLVIAIVAVVVIFSAIVIVRYTGTQEPAESLSGKSTTPTAETGSAMPEAATDKTTAKRKSAGMSAIADAAAADKYAFLFFYSDEGELTQSGRAVFHEAMSKVKENAVPVEIDITDPAETRTASKFNVSRAPMPLVLAVAPNGAITGGFPQEFEETQLLEAFASRCEEKSLKALQDRKVVLLCVQNGNTKLNDDAMKGVQDFKADPNYGPSTEIVILDPADPSESDFLRALEVSPQTDAAVTVCLIPPGSAVARLTGATEKKAIVAALSSSGGCGPGGCGPSGCGN